jgi:hypothetical protein
MKRTGLVILIIGLIITLFTGFNFFTREKVVDIGELEIMANKKHSVAWSPWVGVAVMAVGAGVYLAGSKK